VNNTSDTIHSGNLGTGQKHKRLLVAASGTGGHLFPALAVAQALPDYEIEWLGVPNRLETQLVPADFPLHTVNISGIQKGLSLQTFKLVAKLLLAAWRTRKLLKRGKFDGVFTTGGYISAPAIMAARSLGLPAILHESNALPGKVTRLLSGWCTVIGLGLAAASRHLPKAKTVCVGTPVRADFLQATPLPEISVDAHSRLVVVMGGSQGAVALNQMVREAAPSWLEAGAWVVHLTGKTDSDTDTIQHPHYVPLAFFDNMAGLLQRADLAVCRSGASSLTELAITGTPSLLVPYPFAAEDHQAINAKVFVDAGAAVMVAQKELTAERLASMVLDLLNQSEQLAQMGQRAQQLAVPDSNQQLATLVRQTVS
jgi:UDP-N-acetylglucosamine--N-acetylmuramyl-(pentapeptide) pyrophosphoryl-undecaprenol N-acetylglucosamine transferase